MNDGRKNADAELAARRQEPEDAPASPIDTIGTNLGISWADGAKQPSLIVPIGSNLGVNSVSSPEARFRMAAGKAGRKPPERRQNAGAGKMTPEGPPASYAASPAVAGTSRAGAVMTAVRRLAQVTHHPVRAGGAPPSPRTVRSLVVNPAEEQRTPCPY